MSEPTLRLLSLGAGVQSTALLLLSAAGELLPRVDAAIFADTGWEPPAVYEHLERLTERVAAPAGIAVHRVSAGNLREDVLNPRRRFVTLPGFVRNPDGSEGMAHRQCTGEYKLRPVREQTRRLLGAVDKANGRPGRVPSGRWAETWVGISTDERDRAAGGVPPPAYTVTRYPLLELGWSRADCDRFLARSGWAGTVKSACIGCPFHNNLTWRKMRDERPAEWADAVAFDRQIRGGGARARAAGKILRGTMFLHRSRVPLDQAPIDYVTAREWATRQGDLLELALVEADERAGEQTVGCSPYSCRG